MKKMQKFLEELVWKRQRWAKLQRLDFDIRHMRLEILEPQKHTAHVNESFQGKVFKGFLMAL